MIKLLRKVHFAYSCFSILFFFILFWPFYYLGTRNEKYYSWVNKLRAVHAFLCTFFVGIIFSFEYEEALLPNQTYIYCANHASNLDIIIFCLMAKGKFHFMGKEELMKNPVLGIFFRTIDIAVSRESKISAFRAFKKAGENLEKGMSLIIFPEGRIDNAYPPVLQEFKNGPFRLAIEKNIPIIPVSLTNVWKLMWDDGLKYGTRPGIGKVYVHKPVTTTNLSDDAAELLKDEIYRKINSKL
jgi:1-acyl-sn-glycerol-3-phosphate acyltransferase